MRRLLALSLIGLLAAAPASAATADLPQFQFWYQPEAGSLLWAIACGSDGTLAAGDVGTNTLRRLTNAGVLLHDDFPVPAPPVGVAVSGDGTVWVATDDGVDQSARSFAPDGSPLADVPVLAAHVAVAPGGDAFVAANSTITRLRPDGSVANAWAVCATPNSCIGVHVRGVAVAPDTTVFYSYEDGSFHEIRWFHPAGGGGAFAWPWPASVRRPWGVALDRSNGAVYAAFAAQDGGLPGVLVYSAAGDTLGSMLLPKFGATTPTLLGGMTTDLAGHLHVPTSVGVARLGLGIVPTRQSSWGAIKRLSR